MTMKVCSFCLVEFEMNGLFLRKKEYELNWFVLRRSFAILWTQSKYQGNKIIHTRKSRTGQVIGMV